MKKLNAVVHVYNSRKEGRDRRTTVVLDWTNIFTGMAILSGKK